MSAAGGDGARAGGAGTIYTRLNSASYADLRVDNGGLIGTNTPVNSVGDYNLAVLGGAAVDLALSQTLGNLTIGSNSTFLVWPSILPWLVAAACILAGGGMLLMANFMRGVGARLRRRRLAHSSYSCADSRAVDRGA